MNCELIYNNSPLKVKKFKQTLILEKLEMKYEKLKKKQIKKLSKDLLNMSENTLEHNLPNESFCAKSVHSQQNINNYNQDIVKFLNNIKQLKYNLTKFKLLK